MVKEIAKVVEPKGEVPVTGGVKPLPFVDPGAGGGGVKPLPFVDPGAGGEGAGTDTVGSEPVEDEVEDYIDNVITNLPNNEPQESEIPEGEIPAGSSVAGVLPPSER